MNFPVRDNKVLLYCIAIVCVYTCTAFTNFQTLACLLLLLVAVFIIHPRGYARTGVRLNVFARGWLCLLCELVSCVDFVTGK